MRLAERGAWLLRESDQHGPGLVVDLHAIAPESTFCNNRNVPGTDFAFVVAAVDLDPGFFIIEYDDQFAECRAPGALDRKATGLLQVIRRLCVAAMRPLASNTRTAGGRRPVF